MKIKKSILTIFLVFAIFLTYGQCKYAKKGKIKEVNKELTTQIHTMTNPEWIFSKVGASSQIAFFINENKEYFLAMYLLRDLSPKKFEILKEQKLIISFENNIDLILTSFENAESRMPGLALEQQFIWAAYKIDKEQIKIFAENSLFNVKIYIASQNEIKNTLEDEGGKYFEYEVFNDKVKSNLIEPANCILQIQ